MPPFAQADLSTPYVSAVSLVEVSEMPLRGLSDDPTQGWPVMQSERSERPGTIQEMLHETGKELKQQTVSGQQERYPKLGNSHKASESEQPPVSRYSPMYRIPRKEVSSADLREPSNTSGASRVDKGLSDPFADSAKIPDSENTTIGMTTSLSNLSTAAAAVDKSAKEESKGFPTPRQTRTSSLRARLSAGSIEKDEKSKVLGFTDFTAPRSSSESMAGPNRRDSYRARKEAQAVLSSSSVLSVRTKQSAPLLRTKQSKFSLHPNKSTESIGKGRAPAQFVGGSRRPVPPPRQGSRGSNRITPQGSISEPTSRPTSRSSQALPIPEKRTATSEGAYPIIRRQVQPRNSSIPVPTHVALNAIFKSKDDTSLTSSTPARAPASKGSMTPKKTPRNELNGIYNDRPSADIVKTMKELDSEGMSPFKNRGPQQIFKDAKEYRSLAAIEESPQHSYQTRRLSVKAPEYGPSLRISPSAERFIMGPNAKGDPEKENRPIHEKKEKTFTLKSSNQASKQETALASPATLKKRSDRPLSSHEVLQSTPRRILTDPTAREKKVKSADMSTSLSMDFDLTPGRRDDDASKASSTADPFFDASEQSLTSADRRPKTPENQDNEKKAIEEMDWISPVASKTTAALAAVENYKSLSLPSKQGPTIEDNTGEQQRAARVNPMKDFKIDTDDFSELAGHAKVHIVNTEIRAVKPQVFTPIQSHGKNPSNSGSHPPRSSSRVAHPVFAKLESSLPTRVTAEKKGPPTPPKDFIRRQNNLGSLQGHASSQIDLTKASSKRDSIARDSIARDSVGSKSASKTVFSNLRGLFNRHSSTPESTKSSFKRGEPVKSSSKKIKNKKPSIASSDSPFPPISDINPIHRPTLASTNRASIPRNNHVIGNTNTPAPASRPTGNAPATPAPNSPSPNHVSSSTTLVLSLLEDARNEHSSPKKNQLLKMGEIMVDAITQARDSEKAMEEAKEAARRAEMASARCEKAVGDAARILTEWKRIQNRETV